MSCVENGNVYEFRDILANKEKYTPIATMGSVFWAIDTDQIFIFNSITKTWKEDE